MHTYVHRAVTALLVLLALPAAGQAALTRGDAAYARRAEGARGAVAAAGPIAGAVAAYRQAVAADPRALEPRWKLLRALYFQGEYATLEGDRRSLFEGAKELAEESLDLLAARVGGRDRLDAMEPAEVAKALAGEPAAAPVYFWSAVDWGLFGENVGRLTAARQGVGGTIRDYAAAVVALDPAYESGGGHRLLGRLHAVAPKLPFVTAWVDRDLALEHLRAAWQIGPEEPYNGLYLAEAILEHEPSRRAEAVRILQELGRRRPRPTHQVEDASVLTKAAKLLTETQR